jgi:hypothetical protein
MSLDPVVSNSGKYTTIFENEQVRVLDYHDVPGDETTPHEHPNSVMYTLSPFRRQLFSGGAERKVEMPAGVAVWLAAQEHHAVNIGDSDTHVIFVELKDGSLGQRTSGALGPTAPKTQE